MFQSFISRTWMVLHSITNINRRSMFIIKGGCNYDYIRGLRSRSMHRASNFLNIGQSAITIIVTNRGGWSNRKRYHLYFIQLDSHKFDVQHEVRPSSGSKQHRNQHGNNLKIATWNLCLGLANKKDIVTEYLKTSDISVCCLQETEVSNNFPTNILNCNNYTLELECSDEKQRTGIYVKNTVQCKIVLFNFNLTDITTNQKGMSPCRMIQLGVLLVFSLTLNYFNM